MVDLGAIFRRSRIADVNAPSPDRWRPVLRMHPRHWSTFLLPTIGSIVLIDDTASAAHEPRSAVLRTLSGAQPVRLEELAVLSKTAQKSLVRDLRRLRRVHHPNVQRILGACTHDDTSTFLVVQTFDQGSTSLGLLQFLRETPGIDRRQIVLQILDGLRFLHDLGIIHGDVCSESIYYVNSIPLLCGFPSSYAKTSEISLSSIKWEEDEDELTFSIPTDTDAPAEEIVEYPKLYLRHPSEVPDTEVPDSVKERVPLLLRSLSIPQDLFATGFLVMEIFSELAPHSSLRAFQVLRLALQGQQPAHPSREGALRGLDRFYWQFCLSCWRVGGEPDATLEQHIRRLSQDHSDTVWRAPFALSHAQISDICRHIPDLHSQVHDLRVVKDGRDAEAQLYEVQGTWRHGDECTVVNIITPTLCRRGSLRRINDFESEAFVWSQLRHRNILPFLGTVIYEHTPCFVVPWMEGGTCIDYFRAKPEADRLHILVQVADALHYLHSREPPIVHRCVRASSVFVSATDVAFLGNFDFQPLQDPERNFDDSRLDDAGRWTPPEMIIAYHHSTKTDVFAFAMLAYELYSGRIPFYGMVSVRKRIIAGQRPQRPQHISLTEIWAVVERCWDHSPAARPSMGTVVRELGKGLTVVRQPEE
ncbi:kinase-like protein [Exidia glandulosa HHB12029]|uniref:Kinase-like protein n=1 Tax=Exidia glandulosa HHB12029 TaxID=1314781 RepID=A0A165BVQ6_EXIGL|nr:kinase-like protein [Exidia glandulosa HHB12029]